MSIERELLQKILTAYREDKSCMSWGVANEIQELLAQPESNEPVAWIYNRSYGDEGLFVECVTTDYWEIDDQQQELGNCSNIRPLYTSPPTRKSLSDEKVMDYLIDQYSFDYKDGFTDGVLWAEQQHGIGVDE